MNRVYTAQSYMSGEMGSFGKAAHMLLRQHQFPDTYDERDVILSADHDRCLMWDRNHARESFTRHLKTGELGIGDWAIRASEEEVMAFLKDILKAEEQYPGAVWTGFRVLGTVNRSNGYPVFNLELFAKHAESKTKVYSGPDAPNVERSQWSVKNIGVAR